MMIPFNKPHLLGNELKYINEAVNNAKISGNGPFTKKCHQFFTEYFGGGRCFLTNSGTAALEMAAILLNLQRGDEVIMPSYTFVSTANAFVLRGAKVRFVDSYSFHPNIDPANLEAIINERTKAIIVVHYAGVACDMDAIMDIARKHNLFVVEDAAQSIDAFYKDRLLGTFGHMSTFSFHETKNIICGEGGLLLINDKRFFQRAEIIWEKGTNRASFSRGEVEKYQWLDIGSSFLPSDMVAAFLYAQIENLEIIQQKRMQLWGYYYERLSSVIDHNIIALPVVPSFAKSNAHTFYLLFNRKWLWQRDDFISFMLDRNIQCVFHYLPLHESPYYKKFHDGRSLQNCVYIAQALVRLPLFYELQFEDIDIIVEGVGAFLEKKISSQ